MLLYVLKELKLKLKLQFTLQHWLKDGEEGDGWEKRKCWTVSETTTAGKMTRQESRSRGVADYLVKPARFLVRV